MFTYVYTYIHSVYIYIYRERERVRDIHSYKTNHTLDYQNILNCIASYATKLSMLHNGFLRGSAPVNTSLEQACLPNKTGINKYSWYSNNRSCCLSICMSPA